MSQKGGWTSSKRMRESAAAAAAAGAAAGAAAASASGPGPEEAAAVKAVHLPENLWTEVVCSDQFQLTCTAGALQYTFAMNGLYDLT